MGRSYTEEEKAFLSQVSAPSRKSSSALQTASTSLTVQEERKEKCETNERFILDPTGEYSLISHE